MFKFDTETNTSMASLVDLLDRQASLLDEQTAFMFLADDEADSTEISYAELDRRARLIAVALQARLERGDRALLLYPAGIEFIAAFFGCLYAGVLAVPVSYPKPRRPMPRLTAIAHDAQAKVVLTTQQTLQTLDLKRTAPELENLEWIPTDAITEGDPSAWIDPAVGRDDLAFLQYTSGSTSVPKGVMVSHGNLLHNLEVIRQGFALEPHQSGVFWLPAYHDMGLIGGILTPLYIGGRSVLLAPTTFLQRPMKWLECISKYRANISGAPNFAYDLCARKSTPEQRQSLDLSSWSLAFCGAEPISAETLERFVEAFRPQGFNSSSYYPCYGLAESTLMVTGGDGPKAPVVATVHGDELAQHRVVPAGPEANGHARRLVGCGQPRLGQEVEVVDAQTKQSLGENRVGEIWIRGRSVAHGYWKRPEETQQTFGNQLASGAGPYLRSGDLGFFRDGELYVTGRVKDVIIIRGRNLYPQDIERTVEVAHPLLEGGQGAAFTVPVGEEEGLVVVQVAHRHADDENWDEVLRAIRTAVSNEHDVPLHAAVLIRQGSIPKTTSGKVQRYLCRESFLAGDLKVVAQWIAPAKSDSPISSPASPQPGLAPSNNGEPVTPEQLSKFADQIEAWLADWLQAQAGIPREQFDRDRPFAEFGLDSLKAVELSQELEDWLHVKVTPVVAWNYPTPATMAAFLAQESLGEAVVSGAATPESKTTDDAELERLLAEVESLSDDEAEAQSRENV